MTVNNEFERIWKEVIVAYFEALSQLLFTETEESTRNLSQSSQFPYRDLNSDPSEYEAGVLGHLVN
jgi:hypothetical protein